MAAFAAIGSIVGAVGAGIAATNKANALEQKAAAEFEAAEETRRRAERNERVMEAQRQKLLGKQAAAFAKGGVDISTGSPLLVRQETFSAVSENIAFARQDAELRAKGLEQQGQSSRNAAGAARTEAAVGAATSVLSFGGSLLGGGS